MYAIDHLSSDGTAEILRRLADELRHLHVRRSGVQRTLSCDTCGWRQGAQFLPWLKAEEHLAEAHQATVDPTGS